MVGKTVDDAVNAALAELNAKNEDVEIEVLEEGSKGFLGMGSKDAKVRVSLKSTPQNKALEFLSQLFDVLLNRQVYLCYQILGLYLQQQLLFRHYNHYQ